MDAVDDYIPTPDRKADMPFLMPVEDVFTISGRGTVATGRVERGQLKLGEEVEIIGLTDERRKTVVTGIEMFHKLLDYAEAGDNVGTLLRGVAKTEIERGQVLCKPGSIHPLTKFVGQVYVLTKDEGGVHPVLQQLSSSVLLPYHQRHPASSPPCRGAPGCACPAITST